jgi:hypothetical protein
LIDGDNEEIEAAMQAKKDIKCGRMAWEVLAKPYWKLGKQKTESANQKLKAETGDRRAET